MAKLVLDTPSASPEQEASERRPLREEIELLAYNIYISRGAASAALAAGCAFVFIDRDARNE